MDGISGALWARLFAPMLDTTIEAELTEHLSYKRYKAKGRTSGNNRNWKRPKQLRTSAGRPRSRFRATAIASSTQNCWPSTRPARMSRKRRFWSCMVKACPPATYTEIYGVEVSADTISAINDKVWPVVEAWQNPHWRPSILSFSSTRCTSICAGKAVWKMLPTILSWV
jgi:putative transposase